MKLPMINNHAVKKMFAGLGIIKISANEIRDIDLLNNPKVESFCRACYLAGLHGESFREIYDNLKSKDTHEGK